jgi:hypothetical protein
MNPTWKIQANKKHLEKHILTPPQAGAYTSYEPGLEDTSKQKIARKTYS